MVIASTPPLDGGWRAFDVRVTREAAGHANLRAHLDRPTEGDGATRNITIAGWVVSDPPATTVEVVDERGNRVVRLPLDVARPDVDAAFPDHAVGRARGFGGTFYAGAQEGTIALGVHAVAQGTVGPLIGTVTMTPRPSDHGDTVSIVIPCYNQAEYLGEAIESALAQSYPHVEVVVVDDGSTDNTLVVAARFPGIQVLSKPNGGLPSARNAGLAACSGAYAVFLDSDDRLRPSAVSIGVDALRERPGHGAVYGWYQEVDASGRPLPTPPQTPLDGDPYDALLKTNWTGQPATAIYRRSTLEAVGWFDESLSAAEDYELNLRVVRSFPTHRHGAVTVEFRRHGGSMSRDPTLMLEHVLRVLKLQWPHVAADRRLRTAWREGRRWWRGYYGGLGTRSPPSEPTAMAPVGMPGLVTVQPTPTVALPEMVLGAAVDTPLPGASVDAAAMEVIGWIVGATAPVAAVEIVDGGDVLAHEPLAVPRPDLTDVYPSVTWASVAGYRATVTFRRPVSEMRLGIRAVHGDGTRSDVGSLVGRRSWRDDPIDGSPLVSVVIPCFNQAHFLRQAIESVLAQTYPHVETVVVDDGSADNTEAVAGEYDSVRCLRQENAGLAGARNTGIRNTAGPFLLFLDADDRLLTGAVEVGLERFRSDPTAALVYGCNRWIGTDGTEVFTPEQLCSDEPYLPLLEMCGIIPGSVLFRRAVFDGGRGFDPSVDASADWDMYLRIARELPVRCHGHTVLEYRRHADNMTNDAARILEAEIAVLQRHRPAAATFPGGSEAVAAGVERSRRVHGPAVVEELLRAVGAGDADAAARRASVLAQAHPGALADLSAPRP